MKEIKVKPLTPEAFEPYGTYRDLYTLDARRQLNPDQPGTNRYYPDLASVRNGNNVPSSFSMSVLSPDEMVVTFLEYHLFTEEAFLALDGDVIVFAGRPVLGGQWHPEQIEAFYLPQGTFIKFNMGVVHGRAFAAGQEQVRVLVINSEASFINDPHGYSLVDSAKVRLVL